MRGPLAVPFRHTFIWFYDHCSALISLMPFPIPYILLLIYILCLHPTHGGVSLFLIHYTCPLSFRFPPLQKVLPVIISNPQSLFFLQCYLVLFLFRLLVARTGVLPFFCKVPCTFVMLMGQDCKIKAQQTSSAGVNCHILTEGKGPMTINSRWESVTRHTSS